MQFADKHKIEPKILDSFEQLWQKVNITNVQAPYEQLEQAFLLAYQAHDGQMRKSGEPYITHPIAVAHFLADKKMDAASIMTALLHDVVEDCDVSQQKIERLFGKEVSDMVAGVTKLGNVRFRDQNEQRAENFRKFILATAADIRVLLVKLADRLHNLSTISYLRADKRQRICQETLDIFVPLANRIGIHDWMEKLQDIAFHELQNEAYNAVHQKLDRIKHNNETVIADTISDLKIIMREYHLRCDISGRIKSAYSIWRKIENKKQGFDNLFDILAFRILVNDVDECYRALGILHSQFKIIPGRFKDYISLPKANGYQSLHTCILNQDGERVEIQIRTRDMHEVSELGIAAHWHYKQHDKSLERKHQGTQYRWLRELLETVENSGDSRELLENSKLDMFQEQVFLFTPNGELIALKRGANAIDFAYAVHTKVGDHCIGAKVNGRSVPIKQALRNGDQVEILTRKDAHPSDSWEHIATTSKAKACIRRANRLRKRSEFISLGKARLNSLCTQLKLQVPERTLKAFAKDKKYQDIEDIYVAIGEDQLSPHKMLNEIYPNEQSFNKPLSKTKSKISKKTQAKANIDDKQNVKITGLIDGMAIHFGKCCHPLPGDRITGIVTTGKGVTVHRKGCNVLEKFVSMPDRWLDIDWEISEHSTSRFVGQLGVVLSNDPKSLPAVVAAIGRYDVVINNLKFINNNIDFSQIIIDIALSEKGQLDNIITSLQILANVYSVKRIIN